MLKVAVIGLGNIGNIHAPAYKSDPLSELVAVCDIIPERADKAAAKYGVRAYYSVEDLLRHEQLHAVSICTAGAENGADSLDAHLTRTDTQKHTLWTPGPTRKGQRSLRGLSGGPGRSHGGGAPAPLYA